LLGGSQNGFCAHALRAREHSPLGRPLPLGELDALRVGDLGHNRLDAVGGFGDEREAASPVDAVARQHPDAGHIAARHQPEAVVLDLMNPAGAARRALGRGWKAGFDEAGRVAARRKRRSGQVPLLSYFELALAWVSHLFTSSGCQTNCKMRIGICSFPICVAW
jgi:hypothetical protein